MVKIILPSAWTTDGQTNFEGAEGLIDDVIKCFAADYPAYRRRLLGPDAAPLTYINVCLDDVMVPRRLRATTQVQEGSTLTIVSPMAGG
jgi:hypothetical protein